ncbi:probable WRKY transcription factor protein 1 [Ceratina calcarata]|uniref:Probable WRKY transcription factor protein 1 n=1 Tax=Ceratina calcarata TaxID=156304 RepID=A0AAJ7IT14_9HYME|nr:probable WRKY transcription factor protein 1 [Ceratina calcarata]
MSQQISRSQAFLLLLIIKKHILSILLLLVFVSATSTCSKNDESSHGGGPVVHRNRRVGLNEYLVPPPPRPKHPVRSGRVVNPSTEPGYFSQFMSWLNPFNYGSTSQSPPLSPHPGPPPQKSVFGAPNSHGPPLNLPPGPPLSPHSGPPPQKSIFGTPSSHGPPPSFPPGPPLILPPVPSFNLAPGPTVYNAPPIHDHRNVFPPQKSRGLYTNKARPCNPCNKAPWIPMQNSGSHPDFSNSYLPPTGHDIQHAASHEIRVTNLSQGSTDQLNHPLDDPAFHSGAVSPIYKPEIFDTKSQSSNIEQFDGPTPHDPLNANKEHFGDSHFHNPLNVNNDPSNNQSPVNNGYFDDPLSQGSLNVNSQSLIDGHFENLPSQGTNNNNGHFEEERPFQNPPSINNGNEHSESPSLPITSSDQKSISNLQIDGDQKQIGTEINQGAISQNHEFVNHKDSYPNPEYNENNDPSIVQHGNNQYFTSFGSPNHDSDNQNSVKSSTTDFSYLSPNPASFGISIYHNQDNEKLNHKYSDDQSPSGSIVKNSHVTTEIPKTNDDSIYFEQSPLFDLTKNGENTNENEKWSTTTNINEATDETIRTTTDYNIANDNIFYEDSNFLRTTESYTQSDIRDINNVFGTTTSTTTQDNNETEDSTEKVLNKYANQHDVPYIPPSGQPGFLWTSFLSHLRNYTELETSGRKNNSKDLKDVTQKQQNVKRNKQVQVIIPYTSDYTPIPFQQSYNDWSVKTNLERNQLRRLPPSLHTDNYLQQESRNDVRVVNQSRFNENDNNKSFKSEDSRSSATATTTTTKANNSIDVRRLQKNIDNWTIQEYSRPTTFSTVSPSSMHPYLSPSKKIPTEYLTTTEPVDRDPSEPPRSRDQSVKTYSLLAGFSFNEVEHEASASDRVEQTRRPSKIERVENPKASLENLNKSKTELKQNWQTVLPVSYINEERVYVVTPQTVLEARNDSKNQREENKIKKLQNETSVSGNDNDRYNLTGFEAIEKAYQVLPQAVNSLAVASTGKENVPLWGIMEHEEFASLNSNKNDEEGVEGVEDVVDGPVLYSGHSKVSRAKR